MPDRPLLALATDWLAVKRLAHRSEASAAARRADVAAIAGRLADALGREDPPGLGPKSSSFDREVGRLTVQDLTPEAMREALGDYAADHADASVRRVLSTWRGLCRWLWREGHLSSDPAEDIEGPGRPDWKSKALDFDELERVVAAAGSTDPQAQHP